MVYMPPTVHPGYMYTLYIPGYMYTLYTPGYTLLIPPLIAPLTLQQCLPDGVTALTRAVVELTVRKEGLTVVHTYHPFHCWFILSVCAESP